MTGCVLAFSGGLDSTEILATRDIATCVFVDYGQPASHAEREASRSLAKRFEVPWEEIHVTGWPLGSMSDPTGEEGTRVVPARNALLASCCAAFARTGGVVYFGAHQGDRDGYPDCRPEFFASLSQAMSLAYGVKVQAPNLHRTKRDIAASLGRVVRDYDFACWSCYTPRAGAGDRLEPCLTCTSCRARASLK